MTPDKLRLAMAAMGQPKTKVGDFAPAGHHPPDPLPARCTGWELRPGR